MRSSFLPRARRWIGASALAIIVGISGGSAFFAASSQMASAEGTSASSASSAQVTPAAQVTVPAATAPAGFADLVDAVKPAVVSIHVEGHEQANPMDDQGYNDQVPDFPGNGFLRKFFGQQHGQGGHNNQDGGNQPQQPDQQPQGQPFAADGSGFLISADGYIVTNNHVVENASKVTVIMDDGTQKTATIVGTDQRSDLAVVKIDGTNLPFVKFAQDDARVGDFVIAIGNPFGFGGTVTAGIVSALDRDFPGYDYGDVLQIDAAINKGNSGGPTFNTKGEVVGVNSDIVTPNEGNIGLAFDIPAKTVEQIANSLIKSGTVTRGYLGVNIQPVTPDIANSLGLTSVKGALVSQAIGEDSPGAKAGVKAGDVITAVDGEQIDDAKSLSRVIGSKAPGTTVQLTIWRDGKSITVSVTLGTFNDKTQNQPAKPAPANTPDQSSVQTDVGLTLVPNSKGDGALVQDVDPNSAAAGKFDPGETILDVNGTKVSNGKDFEDAIKALRDAGKTTALIKVHVDNQGDAFVGLPLGTDSSK